MNLEVIIPRERAGSLTQARFGYQTEFIVYQCIQLLENQNIAKVYCDFHSDCVVKDKNDFHTFYQVKGIKNKLFSVIYFRKNAIEDMFYNFCLADGNCRSVLVTNAQVDHDFEKLLEIKDNLNNKVATIQEIDELTLVKNTWRPKVDSKRLFNAFIDRFEVMDGFPSFSEKSCANGPTLRSTNIDRLKVVLDNNIGGNFSIEDAKEIHDMIYRLAEEKSQLKVRSNRFITKEELLDKVGVPTPLRINFNRKFSEQEIESLKDQSILADKLKQGAFTSIYIKNAKKVRYVTQYFRENLCQNKSNCALIDEFEYRLANACAEVFEEHSHKSIFDAQQMLKDLKKELLAIAEEEKFQRLKLDKDFIKGLVWEATSQCNLWWEKIIEQ